MEPTFSVTTERLWSRLPETYRVQDAAENWTFKTWLAGMVDQAGLVETMIDRFTYTTADEVEQTLPLHERSDLVDPVYADDAWLPWLAQLVGANPRQTTAQLRGAIPATAAFRGGTRPAIIAAAQAVLTGTKNVGLYDHTLSATAIGAASEWNMLIVTNPGETPAGVNVVAAVIAAGAKPAGVLFQTRVFSNSWDQLVAAGVVSWFNWEALTWAQIEQHAIAGA